MKSSDLIDSENTAVREVLLLGDPRLRQPSQAVIDCSNAQLKMEITELHHRLELFRKENKFGRAISAPQIGINKRFIALNLNGTLHTLINPKIVWQSASKFSMWDDCMSFPSLLVKLERHKSISVKFTDADGNEQVWDELAQDISELLQHEIDHLDGILAIDRAMDKDSIVERRAFEQMKAYFASQGRLRHLLIHTSVRRGTSTRLPQLFSVEQDPFRTARLSSCPCP